MSPSCVTDLVRLWKQHIADFLILKFTNSKKKPQKTKRKDQSTFHLRAIALVILPSFGASCYIFSFNLPRFLKQRTRVKCRSYRIWNRWSLIELWLKGSRLHVSKEDGNCTVQCCKSSPPGAGCCCLNCNSSGTTFIWAPAGFVIGVVDAVNAWWLRARACLQMYVSVWVPDAHWELCILFIFYFFTHGITWVRLKL